MNCDVECPYCGEGQEICHDDGYGFAESETYEQQCSHCDKIFAYTTAIHFTYEASKADCLNGSPHQYRPRATFPAECTKMECTDCGRLRKPTEAEMAEILGT